MPNIIKFGGGATDADLIPSNIKNGVDISGVVGTYKGKILEACVIVGWTAPEEFYGFWIDSTGTYSSAFGYPSKTGEYLQMYRTGNIVYLKVIKAFTGIRFGATTTTGTFAINTLLQVSLASSQVQGFVVLE